MMHNPDPIERGVWRLPFRRMDGSRILVAVDSRGRCIREIVYTDDEEEAFWAGLLRVTLDRVDPVPTLRVI